MTKQAHYDTFAAITAAVDAGEAVHWKNDGYKVTAARGDYFITCSTGSTVGLFWLDGVTSDYKPTDFYSVGG